VVFLELTTASGARTQGLSTKRQGDFLHPIYTGVTSPTPLFPIPSLIQGTEYNQERKTAFFPMLK